MSLNVTLSLAAVFALIACALYMYQYRRLMRGEVVAHSSLSGPERVQEGLYTLLRIFIRRSIVWRKILTQHFLHLFVRAAFYLDKFSAFLYSYSRNRFIKQAVKNKSTVSHFWEYLKVYKQEMDDEKRGGQN